MDLERFIIAGMILLLILPLAGANSIAEIISLEFRNKTVEEYGYLINKSLEEFLDIENLILENPSLEGEATIAVNESIDKKKLTIVKEIGKGFVDFSLTNEKRVALIHFNDDAFVDSQPTRDGNVLHSKIDTYKAGGGSCIQCAISKAVDICLKYGLRDILLVSDGHSSTGDESVINEASEAAANVEIHTISLGDGGGRELLRTISEDITNGKFNETTCDRGPKDIYRGISTSLDDAVLILDTSASMDKEFSLECVGYRKICGAGCIIKQIIPIIGSLYVFAITLTGFYLFFISISIEDRSKAKALLIYLLLCMGIVTTSIYTLSALFGISDSLTYSILSLVSFDTNPFMGILTFVFNMGKDIASIMGDPAISLLISPWLIVESILTMLKIRYYMSLLLSVFFPFTMLLYSLTFTRGLGKFMLEQTLLWIFAQVAMALVFVIVGIGISLTDGLLTMIISNPLKLIMELAGLIMLMVTPVAFVKIFGGFLR